MKTLDHTGKKFGRLSVLGIEKASGGHRKWTCICECGKAVVLRSSQVQAETVASCGCLRSDKQRERATSHGLYSHASYGTWNRMMQRCHNSNSQDFEDYGGRGIFVCEKWHEVAAFILDMGERPVGTSIDRVDNEKGYQPGNCRWATPVQQANNTRRTRNFTHDGRTQSIAVWERELEIKRGTLWARINRGAKFADAIAIVNPVSK